MSAETSLSADLCLSLSGRLWMWPIMRTFLEDQQYPHTEIHLIILDTSQNPTFTAQVKQWVEGCGYGKVTYTEEAVGVRGLADLPRDEAIKEVCKACVKIYNRFPALSQSPVVFFLEDDVIPPLDAYVRLNDLLQPGIASVSALYYHREKPEPVCWNWDGDAAVFPKPQTGVTPIGGNGFGCVAMWGTILRRTQFQCGPDWQNYDHHFYKDLQKEGGIALLDWDCVCRHYSNPNTWC